MSNSMRNTSMPHESSGMRARFVKRRRVEMLFVKVQCICIIQRVAGIHLRESARRITRAQFMIIFAAPEMSISVVEGR